MYLIFLMVYFAWLALQNTLLPWLYANTNVTVFAMFALLGSKEVILILALLILSFRIRHPGWAWLGPDRWALAYLGLLSLYLVFPGLVGSSMDWGLRLVSFRSLVTFVLFYFWGRLSLLSLRNIRTLGNFLVVFHAAVAAFGLIEWALLPTTFWSETVGLGPYMLQIKGLALGWNVVDDLPSNLFRFDQRRLISVYADPLGMGAASVFPLVLALALADYRGADGGIRHSRRRYAWIAALSGVALLLTIARESIGTAILALGLVAAKQDRLKAFSMLFVLVLLCVLLIQPTVITYALQTVSFQEESAQTHLAFLMGNVGQLWTLVWGKGLGEAGGWAFSLAGVESDVGESAYFELMAQAGILSVLLLLGFFGSIVRNANRASKVVQDQFLRVLLVAVVANLGARMVMTIFSPSVFGVIPMASFFFVAGAALTGIQGKSAGGRSLTESAASV